MARAQGARSQLAAAFESTYGVAPTSGFFRMPFASASLGADQPLLDNELLGYGRDPLAPVKDAITVDGDIEIPVDRESIGVWLKGAFGAPTTTGTTNKTHTFKSGAWTLPSLSIEVAMPEVPRYAMYTGCMVDQIAWRMERSGLLTASVSVVAQGETVANTSAAGTPTDFTLQRFGHFNGSIKRNGTALGNIVSAEVTYQNNLDRVETIRSDGKIDGADPTITALTGNITARFADTTLIDQAINGASAELEFAWAISANVSLKITAHAVYLPRPRLSIDGPDGVQATFDWQAALDSAAGQMCTVVLKNQVASY